MFGNYLPYDRDNSPYSGKDPNLDSSKNCVVKGEAKVSLEPTGTQVPAAENNPYAKAAYPGDTCPEPLYHPVVKS